MDPHDGESLYLVPRSITGYTGQRKLAFNLTRIKEMIQEGLASITRKHWSDCVDHVKQVENVYWASNIARDEMPELAIITLTESDEATYMTDEFEDDMICYTSTCIIVCKLK